MKHLARLRVASIAVLLGACVLELLGQNGIIARMSEPGLSPLPAISTWLVAVVLIGLSIRYNPTITRMAGRGAAVARFGGRITYPLYLIHDPVCFALAVLLAPWFGQAALFIAIGGAFGAAGLIESSAERRVRRVLGHVLPTEGPSRLLVEKQT